MGSMQGQSKEGSNTARLYVRVKKPPAEINVVLTLDVDRGTADIL